MLGEAGSLNLFLTSQVDIFFILAFREIIVKVLRARLNSSSGHMKAPGLSLPTSAETSQKALISLQRLRRNL